MLQKTDLAPLLLETSPTSFYSLLDSGNKLKLERCGNYKIIRPAGQAIWQPSLDRKAWQDIDAEFTGNTEEEGVGRWHFPKSALAPSFVLQRGSMKFLGRFTSFRHIGFFPEQEAHWCFIEKLLRVKPGAKTLNLFAYTGLASLIAANAGAQVTHVDSSKRAIAWAKENQAIAGLNHLPIRWITEDATKFAQREARRNNKYDLILLDPPAYGRGNKGEIWQLFEDLPALLSLCRELLDKNGLGVILTAYSIRASYLTLQRLMQEIFGQANVESGELILREENTKRALSTSLFSRFIINHEYKNH
ncbi:class I SAM-dependent methyltransferase [Bartonella sp. TP]|uniref:class I SAM-dependent methyltransferase n=1 Tax=Bartonella sp. TP TaxID=3057550 RepID=UPI0025AF0233|nr:class I SAM-dependent methyltransferase [Bartonella sp. TP]WJW80525.1 class I SAM-dependent methyltransferase [Bartonella sp. TP]